MIKNSLSFLGSILLIFSISLSIFLIIPLIPVLGSWYQLAVVQSASMEPNLPVGSLALYQPQQGYHVGEVIAYEMKEKAETRLVMHRIARKNEENRETLYFTQGDATAYLSPQAIHAQQVKGKLITFIPSAGYVVSWFQSRLGISVVVGTLLGFLIIYELTQPRV